MTPTTAPCPGCGAGYPVADPAAGATHRYLLSSPECFAAFGEVLAVSYEGLRYAPGDLHQTRVDAWACQHPGTDSPASNQAIALCLMTLRLVVEDGVDPARGPTLHRRMSEHGPYEWLAPPTSRGWFTVRDVLARPAQDQDRAVTAWAGSVWDAWSPHRGTVQAWLVRSGTTPQEAHRYPRPGERRT